MYMYTYIYTCIIHNLYIGLELHPTFIFESMPNLLHFGF